jgi:rRNA maturation endonuclease Nob1
MAFFEKFGKKVGEAAQVAAKKSGEVVEITKLSMNIAGEEDKVKALYCEIGKKAYENYAAGAALEIDDFRALLEQVDREKENIKELKAKILDVKNMRVCPSCGKELDKSVAFCEKCGTKQEEPATEAPEAE